MPCWVEGVRGGTEHCRFVLRDDCEDTVCNGFGHGLLELLMQQAKVRDAEVTFLEVRESNLNAAGLYESFGFNEIGRRRNYYPAVGGREDALVMAYSLVD